MKKILLLLLFFSFFPIQGFSNIHLWVSVTKHDGKQHKGGHVTYGDVQKNSYLFHAIVIVNCSGPGEINCPSPKTNNDPIGTTTVGEALEVAEK